MKTHYTNFQTRIHFLALIFVGLFLFGITQNVQSQTNLARSATANHSGGGQISTGYGPPLYNDGVIYNYNIGGTYNWGWVTTSGWIDFTWTSAKTISKMVFYKDNRPMTTCTLQYWNGSAFVNFYTYSNSNIQDSITFSPVTTTVLRMNTVAGSSNPNHREIKIYGPSSPNDAGITALVSPVNPCGAVADPVIVQITNMGTNAIAASSGVAINARLSGTASGTYTKTFNRALAGGASDTIHITTLNTASMFGNLTVKAWARWSADTTYKNDTNTTTISISGSPAAPKPKNVIKCGQGSVRLNAGVPSNTSAIWYNSNTSTTALGMDSIYNTPFLYGGTTTYYVESARLGATKSLATGITAGGSWFGNVQSGNMFNITANKTLILDSMSLNINHYNPITVNVFIRSGTYVGYQTNASAWTLIRTVTSVASKGIGNRTTFSMAGAVLPIGAYGIYVQVSDGIIFNSGALSFTNADMTLQGGDAISGNFAGIATNYTWAGNVYYRTLCTGPRVAVTATVKPSPYGGAFTKGTPFTTTRPTSLGTKGDPDIVAAGDKLTYEITPPTGYSNPGYGSTWLTANFAITTKSGRILPSSYYNYNAPSSSGNGKITFSADSLITDTALIMTISLKDLGPHYCDSTLTRHIFVAPRPVTDFKFNQPVCDGESVLFNNLTKISSGYVTYKWDFNTGNPADTSSASDVVFTFPTYGFYMVKLTAKSMPYGYETSKTIVVVVTQIPKVSFNVLNACEKIAVKFKNNTTYTGSGTVIYSWDFGDPQTTLDKSSKKDDSWVYANPGGYRVRLIANVNGCSSEMSKNANQFANPVAKYSLPMGSICDKTDIQFTNESTIKMGNMGYTWDFGDGGISNFASPNHQFANATTRQVKLKTVSEFGCLDSITKSVVLNESPDASFTWGPACNLTPIDFTFTGKKPTGWLTTFNWNFAGEGSTTLENPTKLFSVVGKKMVTLTLVSNNGCKDIVSKEVAVKLQSKADFTIADVCEDDDAVFTNKSTVSLGNLIYNWKFGDATSSASQSPRHRYTINGISQTFNVTLVAIVPGGCSDSINKQVSVNAKPKSDFTFTKSGRSVYFTPTQAGNTLYQWRFGDGGNSTVFKPKYDYLNFKSGNYTVCLAVVNAAGCFSESCKDVFISGDVKNINKTTGTSIYPNPNQGNFTINVEDPKANIAISIYNVLGDKIKTIDDTPFQSTYTVDLNAANGIYLVKVTNGSSTTTQKVTINK